MGTYIVPGYIFHTHMLDFILKVLSLLEVLCLLELLSFT